MIKIDLPTRINITTGNEEIIVEVTWLNDTKRDSITVKNDYALSQTETREKFLRIIERMMKQREWSA